MPVPRAAKNKNLTLMVCLFVVIFPIAALIAPAAAWAHNVNVFAYIEGETVVAECYFNDGAKCRDSTIEVFDKRGKKLAEGKTDEEGRFSFRPPVRTDLVIRLTTSMGHQAEYTVPASDLPEGLPAALQTAAETSGGSPAQNQAAARPAGLARESRTQEATVPADIERIIDKALARQLVPILRALEESRRARRFSDIVGGIGYIVGMMGLALYFLSRRRREK